MWNAKEPRIACIKKIEKTIQKLPKAAVVRMGGMTDCFQPLEEKQRVALETIKLLNKYEIGYLIVTKSSLIAEKEYINVMDKNLAHIQVTITCLDDERANSYEHAAPPGQRVRAITTLQEAGFDVALRLSPLVEEYIDFKKLNELHIEKCLVEFLRVNTFIKKWFAGVDFSKYTLRQGNYYHLPLEEKLRVLEKIKLSNITVCDDVSEHYVFWKNHYNPNQQDCCNLACIKNTIASQIQE